VRLAERARGARTPPARRRLRGGGAGGEPLRAGRTGRTAFGMASMLRRSSMRASGCPA